MANGPTPEQLAKSGSEDAEQTALFAWAALNVGKYPALRMFFAIPNGGQRGDGTRLGAQIAGGKLLAQGVKPGVSDTLLAHACGGWHGLFIEMKPKPPKRCVVSDEQRAWIAAAQREGYAACVCYGWEQAASTLVAYMTQGLDIANGAP